MQGTLAIQAITRNGIAVARVIVRGNVGDENRAKLDNLGMTPVIDISNCREKIVTNNEDVITLRNALIEQGIVPDNRKTKEI